MKTTVHQQHIETRVIHNNCRECRADCERRFVDTTQWRYAHVHDYLGYVQPRIDAIAHGANSVESRQWLKDFRKALNRRINMKVGLPKWRKLSDSYLERCAMMRHVHDETYLREFARTKASALV